jgi:hypothetical protein
VISTGVGLSIATAEDAEGTISIESPEQANPGDTVTLTVRANTTQKVYAIDFLLRYDSDKVEVVSVSPGSFLSEDAETIIGAANAAPNKNEISYAESRAEVDSGVAGEGELATITIEVAENATEPIEFEFIETEAVDSDVDELNITTRDGSLSLTDNHGGSGTEDGGAEGDDSQNTSGTEDGGAEGDDSQNTITNDSIGEWSPKITTAVRSRLNSTRIVGIRVVVNDDPAPVADALHENGATNIQELPTGNSVAGFANESTIREISSRDDVIRIEYDETTSTLDPGEIELVDATVPSTAVVNESQNITIVLTNSGGTEVHDEFTVYVNGEAVTDKEISVLSNERIEISVEVPFDEQGDATVSLVSTQINMTKLGTVSVSAGVETTSVSDQESGSSEDSQTEIPGFGMFAAMFAIVAFTILTRCVK